ncbi:hypothetical protein F5B18DRAFT_594024 [Nemania serpens]|nr:hypothetical protein F5B18DRAFT_594024 [Nemania serpens]
MSRGLEPERVRAVRYIYISERFAKRIACHAATVVLPYGIVYDLASTVRISYTYSCTTRVNSGNCSRIGRYFKINITSPSEHHQYALHSIVYNLPFDDPTVCILFGLQFTVSADDDTLYISVHYLLILVYLAQISLGTIGKEKYQIDWLKLSL